MVSHRRLNIVTKTNIIGFKFLKSIPLLIKQETEQNKFHSKLKRIFSKQYFYSLYGFSNAK